MDKEDPENLKSLILESTEPLLIKHSVNSEILHWSLEDWATKLKEEVLEFRVGKYEHTAEPQWERKTPVIKSSFKYFLKYAQPSSEGEQNDWIYFDYKYLETWFTNIKELRNCITSTWAPLGFPNVTAEDCTIWIGSKGAHTPCHIDTYGFNLIYQVYGRKLWIVAPPEENLKPTRIPYEESSIYSKLNFFSPNIKDFKGVSNCRKIVLNPGEVLYLPHKWWHYVENLETAVSINVWIPLPQDDEERFKESIVQLFVKQMVGVSNKERADQILNPNMEESMMNSDISDMLQTIGKCKKNCKHTYDNKKLKKNYPESSETNSGINESEILNKLHFVENIQKMSQEEFKLFLEEQSSRFGNANNEEILTREDDLLELLNTFTDNDVVSLITAKLSRTKT